MWAGLTRRWSLRTLTGETMTARALRADKIGLDISGISSVVPRRHRICHDRSPRIGILVLNLLRSCGCRNEQRQNPNNRETNVLHARSPAYPSGSIVRLETPTLTILRAVT